MGRVRDIRKAAATKRAIASLKRDAFEVNGSLWDTDPVGQLTPYPVVWVEAAGRTWVRALEQAHYHAREQGHRDLDFEYQWVSSRPLSPEDDAGIALLTIIITNIDGTVGRLALWFPLPTFVTPLRTMADAGGLCVTSMTPDELVNEPIWRAFSVAFTPPVEELGAICDTWGSQRLARP